MLCSGYYGASHGAGVHPRRTVCLICSSAHVPGYLGTLSQCSLHCLLVSWVVHYLVLLEPSIQEVMNHKLSQQIA